MLVRTADAVTAVFQVLAFGGVVGQADRALISRDGLFRSSEPVQQVRAGGLGRLEAAGVLTGVHHGLANGIDPGPAAVGNVSREPDLALPFVLDDALARLDAAEILKAYLGEETLTLYRETKRIETQRLRRVMTAAEYDWYL